MSQFDDLLEERTDASLIAAERSVVGSMMLDSRCVEEVRTQVRATDFYDVRYQAIAETCFELHQKSRPIDVITVGTRMRTEGRFNASFSEILLHELVGEVPTAASAGYYAGIVAGGAARRRLRMVGIKLIGAADDPSVDMLHTIEEGRELLDDALPGDLDQRKIGSFSDAFFESMQEETEHAIPTPWPDLTALIHGWKPGKLVVIGARPAQGKTLVGCQLAMVAAQNHGVAYFTGEMDQQEILARLYSAIGGIPIGAIERRNIEPFQQRFDEARRIVDGLNLYVNDRASSWDDIEIAVWDLYRKGGLKMVVVDYVGLYGDNSGRHESRRHEMDEMSRRAKKLSKRLKITVVLLSQLNRGGAAGAELKRPQMEHLKETGALEQDADLVILLHQGLKQNPVTKQQDRDGSLWLYVEKQRNGPTGAVKLNFEGAYSRALHIPHAR